MGVDIALRSISEGWMCKSQPGTPRNGCLTVMGMIRVMEEPLLD